MSCLRETGLPELMAHDCEPCVCVMCVLYVCVCVSVRSPTHVTVSLTGKSIFSVLGLIILRQNNSQLASIV